jgi:hypothetical protein
MLAHRALVQRHIDRIRVHQPGYEFLKDAIANDVRDPREFFTALALPVAVSGLAACMAPGTQLRESPKILGRSLFDPETGRLDTRALARAHVVEGYWGKSLRCRNCRINDRCDGAHINFLRDQGFAQLEPLRDGAWAEEAERQIVRLRPQPPQRLRDGKPLEPVAPSLPGFDGPQALPEEPLMANTRRAREAREKRWAQLRNAPSA